MTAPIGQSADVIFSLGAGLVGGALGWQLYSRALRTGAAPVRSLAVLPLANLSADPEQQYFADGMTKALITDLAQLGRFRATTSDRHP